MAGVYVNTKHSWRARVRKWNGIGKTENVIKKTGKDGEKRPRMYEQ